MRDKFGEELFPGDEIVYTVSRSNYPELKYSIVTEAHEDHIRARSQGGEGPLVTLNHPERIVSLSAIEHKGYYKGLER